MEITRIIYAQILTLNKTDFIAGGAEFVVRAVKVALSSSVK